MQIRSYWVRLFINLTAKSLYWLPFLFFELAFFATVIERSDAPHASEWQIRLLCLVLFFYFPWKLWQEKNWVMHRIMFSGLPPRNEEIARWRSANQHTRY